MRSGFICIALDLSNILFGVPVSTCNCIFYNTLRVSVKFTFPILNFGINFFVVFRKYLFRRISSGSIDCSIYIAVVLRNRLNIAIFNNNCFLCFFRFGRSLKLLIGEREKSFLRIIWARSTLSASDGQVIVKLNRCFGEVKRIIFFVVGLLFFLHSSALLFRFKLLLHSLLSTLTAFFTSMLAIFVDLLF